MKVIKRDGSIEDFDINKIEHAIEAAYTACGKKVPHEVYANLHLTEFKDGVSVEEIQNVVETLIDQYDFDVAKAYILYRERHKTIRNFVATKEAFINKYKKSSNTANATIDDNSNVGTKNIGVLNAEIHKEDNKEINRGMVTDKLKELFPDFDYKQYKRDLENHIIYKHDESSMSGAIAPYCCSISMYPFLLNGLKDIGGLSAAPKNLDSFCGLYINLIFAVSAQFLGAVATSEVLLYFDYFCRKEWGDDYWKSPDTVITNEHDLRTMTIEKKIHQYFQQIIYSINQPAAARGLQSAFVNWSFFDHPFFDAMFENFVFPDGSKPIWESLSWLQRDFMQWFNKERLKCILTFPVESFALIYKDGHFVDQDSADFVAKMYSEGHSFFTYISDTADSLSSCCRLKNKLTTHEFNFTNGNMGVETGSKSVITLNLSRIIQDWFEATCKDGFSEAYIGNTKGSLFTNTTDRKIDYTVGLKEYIISILERVYKYHIAYNECLWDMYDANLLPVYKAGFISLNKQYLTIGINGLNAAAEYLGIQCNNNKEYQDFCEFIFSTIKDFNAKHNGKFNGHKITLNTECVPAESLAIKNYNWDKKDGYWVNPDDTLYASYIFKPNDEQISVLDKFILHGRNYIGDFLDGGAAAHINLDHHLNYEQYRKLLKFAADNGCQYFTFNIPNCQCDDCGFITKHPIKECPKCGSTHITWYDRVIGYITPIKHWSDGRRLEKRVYSGDTEDLIRDQDIVTIKEKQ